ncbi:MAG: hypothetical protein ACTHL8_21630 [Burkholderiaceae bacterium]
MSRWALVLAAVVVAVASVAVGVVGLATGAANAARILTCLFLVPLFAFTLLGAALSGARGRSAVATRRRVRIDGGKD